MSVQVPARIEEFLAAHDNSELEDLLRTWLQELPTSRAETSDSARLGALMLAGLQTIEEQSLDGGYAILADELASHGAERRAARERYVARSEAGR